MHAKDNTDILYDARNIAQTTLKQSLTFSAKIIIVDSTETFANFGLLRIGPKAGQPGEAEIVYYGKKTGNTFHLRAYPDRNKYPAC